MKRFALAFGVLAILLPSLAAAKQQQKSSDEEAVRATVADYIEGYYTGVPVVWRDRFILTT